MNQHAGFPGQFLTAATPSFMCLVAAMAPEILPGALESRQPLVAPHGTTIVAVCHSDGVVMAGDRRATMGNVIAAHDLRKVVAADEFTAVGISGTAGLAMDLVRLFQVELEHYEKIEGAPLTFDGKATRLAAMVRANLGPATQGLAAVPILAGWDGIRKVGRIVSFDVVGGRYDEQNYHAIGSGAGFARSSLKKLVSPDMGEREAAVVAVQALWDSADDDAATAGPNPYRRLYPTMVTITEGGARDVTEAELHTIVSEVITSRKQQPDGPKAPML